MKIKKALPIWFLLAVFALAAFQPLAAAADQDGLRAGCLAANARALEMEIAVYEQRLAAAQDGPGNPADVTAYKERLAELRDDLAAVRSMDPARYHPPNKITATVTVSRAYGDGSLLELVDITRSGPFYHLAGIRGGDYGALRPGRTYVMTFYPVCGRDYVLPRAVSQYVYLDEWAPVLALDPRRLGEEVLLGLSTSGRTLTIRAAGNGCTDRSSFRVDVRREEGPDPQTPHYVLTFIRIRIDECKAFLPDGVLIDFDLEKDIGLTGRYTFSVANMIRTSTVNDK